MSIQLTFICIVLLMVTNRVDAELCHISDYDFVKIANAEFNNVELIVGNHGASSSDVSMVAVRVIATQVDFPRQSFVVARRVYEHMAPYEIVDALYAEYPRRRYLACGTELYQGTVHEFIVASITNTIVVKVRELHELELSILALLICSIILVVVLLVERV